MNVAVTPLSTHVAVRMTTPAATVVIVALEATDSKVPTEFRLSDVAEITATAGLEDSHRQEPHWTGDEAEYNEAK